MKQCILCDEKFETHLLMANHVRWHHHKIQTSDKARAAMVVAQQLSATKIYGERVIEMRTCAPCDTQFEVSFRISKPSTRKFCSRSCANRARKGTRTEASPQTITRTK